MSKDRMRYFFPQDEKEYQKELEEESQEWELMKVYHEAVAQGYTPDKENKITVVDSSGNYKVEFRAITRGQVRKVVMKDIKNRIERHYWIANNQRHGLFMELRDKKVVRMCNYRHNKPQGRMSVWSEEKGDYITEKYFD